ncbi:hypothetical protein ACW9J6_32970 [Methylobacterium sp. JK268]
MHLLSLPIISGLSFVLGCAFLRCFHARASYLTPILIWIAAILASVVLIAASLRVQVDQDAPGAGSRPEMSFLDAP